MNQSAVHQRIYALFPMLLVNGWKYSGFSVRRGRLDEMKVVLDFKKMVAGKMAGCTVPVPMTDCLRDSFNLRGHITETLAKAETHLTNRRLTEMEGAA